MEPGFGTSSCLILVTLRVGLLPGEDGATSGDYDLDFNPNGEFASWLWAGDSTNPKSLPPASSHISCPAPFFCLTITAWV